MTAPIPDDEIDRLAALRRYRILDTAPEQAFDDITQLASFICGAPTALVTLVDRERQWFKSKLGLTAKQTPRHDAFCAYTILQPRIFIVEDATMDERFSGNSLVTGDPYVRFYAGAPLLTPEGHALGSMCVIDQKPRQLSDEQKSALERLARLVMTTLELRRISADLADAMAHLKTLSGLLPICAYCKKVRNDEGYWQQLEAFVEANSNTMLSHGICPECSKIHFAGVLGKKAIAEIDLP